MEYRSYTIYPSSWLPGKFEYRRLDYNGEVCTTADSIQEAKEEIDYELYMKACYPVQCLSGTIIEFCSLETAMRCLSEVRSAVPLFSFEAM